MHAIIKMGDGKYYISSVFGYYNDVKSEGDYQRYLERIHTPYYVVFNEEKTKLIKWYNMQPDTEFLIKQVLIIDSDESGWNINEEDGTGGVEFLPRELADKIISEGSIPDDIMQQCKKIEESYVYDEYREIKTEKDIEDFDWATGNFHDAYIKEQKILEGGELYLRFSGIWGCQVEIWFWDDLEYCSESRNPEYSDPYWSCSTLELKNGYVYFVDGEIDVKEITDGYCWFKARHMKYHIIPN